MIATVLVRTLYIIYTVLDFAILAYVLMSWIVRPNTNLANIYMTLAKFLEPIMYPVRKIMQPLTYKIRVDFSPWITIILIRFIYQILARLICMIF